MSNLRTDVPLAEYLRWPQWSQTTLKQGLKSMAHAKAAFDRTRETVPTDDMVLGSVLHCAFLEPEYMPRRVVCWDGPRRAGKEWEAFRDEHAGKAILTAGMYERLCGMVQAMRRHKFVRKWSGRITDVEVSATGSVFGLPMKGRCDALTDDPLVDIKATNSADPGAFSRTVRNMGYRIQGAVYAELFQQERFILLAVETHPSYYDVVPYELDTVSLRIGRRVAKLLIGQVLECQASGVWPGRSDEIIELSPEEWEIGPEDIQGATLGGKRLRTSEDDEFDALVAQVAEATDG